MNMIINANAISIPLKDNSIHCIVTSPPYWGLRDYELKPTIWGGNPNCKHQWDVVPIGGRNKRAENDDPKFKKNLYNPQGQSYFCKKCNAWLGQLGLEPSPELYIEHMIQIFRELRRVLRSDGTIWLNMGDSFGGGKGQSGQQTPEYQKQRHNTGKSLNKIQLGGPRITIPKDGKHSILKSKDLCGIPWRLALALQQDGWWLRSDIIWSKPSCMPESVNGWRWERHKIKIKSASNYGKTENDKKQKRTNTGLANNATWQNCPGCSQCTPNNGYILKKGSWRPTRSHEYIFLLAKSEKYYCDADALRESHKPESYIRVQKQFHPHKIDKTRAKNNHKNKGILDHGMAQAFHPNGRNKRDVWTINPAPYPDAHFATFPPRLPELCIKAGTSEAGVCPKCGAPWARIVETNYYNSDSSSGKVWQGNNKKFVKGNEGKNYKVRTRLHIKTEGWRPTCTCNAGEPIPATVLDPFAGSGTTLNVARRLERKCIGLELQSDYFELIKKRLKINEPDLFLK
jgi:DNA modification methylase